MSNIKNVTIWGIHSGRYGEADELFLKRNRIAIGWDAMTNAGDLKADRETFKAAYMAAYPNDKPGAVPGQAGQIFRFLHEMKKGDLVIYPSKHPREIHIGQIAGDYQYNPKADPEFPHQREVKWLKSFPRTSFSQGALYEIGAAMSLFQVKNYANEYVEVLEGKSVPVVPDEDNTVAAVAGDIEETTRDFVIKTLSAKMKGLPLEEFIQHLLECMGYHARLTKKNEPSVDLIAHKDLLGIEPPIIKVQVKSGDGAISHKDVSALYGTLSPGEYGLFIALGSFTPPSLAFEQSKGNLRLIDGGELVDLIFEHYDSFDSRYKGLLPLRRVFVPEA